jgi:2-dehydro-3-deoxyphosphogluconate aldolase/(4S)-4-hydroxy-2-oxoglutarate aldolase
MKDTIINKIQEARIIPVYYHSDADTCKNVIDACYKGGIRVFEFVNRGKMAAVNFTLLKNHVQESWPGLIFGAGSILNRQQAEKFIELGADFIVSPILSEEIAQTCKDHGIYWIPGCATPTEIAKANDLGADIIKVFPGNVLGSGFIKSVIGPMPGLKLMPTGGVEPTKENLSAWFGSGAACVGMGSKLIDQKMTDHPELLSKR